MTTTILSTYLPGEGHFHSDRFDVLPWCCDDDLDYWGGLVSLWNRPVTIVNVEHDVEVTGEHIDALLACPHPLCSWAYESHWISTHQPRDVISARNPDGFITEATEWAEQSAIGLVKITPGARIAPLVEAPWCSLEVSVENAVKRPWHMHFSPPLPHHHW